MSRIGRLALMAAFALLAVALMMPLGLGWLYTEALLAVPCGGPNTGLGERGYPAERVSFPSRDGPTLRGWFTPGDEHPHIAIIVLPGASGNSHIALNDAEIFAAAGYSTLVYEHRTCADPDLHMSTGYQEHYDLLGAVDYLQTRPEVTHIGGMGHSAGGTAMLLAAAETEAIEAVIATGGFPSLHSDIYDGQYGLFGALIRHGVAFGYTVRVGTPPREVAPVDGIATIEPRPVLLIYGSQEAIAGEELLAAAGPNAELWVVEGAGHGAYPIAAPEEYRRRMVAHMDAAFAHAFE